MAVFVTCSDKLLISEVVSLVWFVGQGKQSGLGGSGLKKISSVRRTRPVVHDVFTAGTFGS